MANGLHHPHVRKRMYVNLEPFPHPHFFKRFLDTLIYIAGFLGPAFTAPQIYAIYSAHDATSVSAITWGAYALLDIVWVVYGLAHRERIIVFTYTLWFIANASVAAGAVLYGAPA